MKTSTKCFWLRTVMVACICGAAIFFGAYTTGRLCPQMALTPLCLLLARTANQCEQALLRQERARRAARHRMRVYTQARTAAVATAGRGAIDERGYVYAHACGDEMAENEFFAIKSRKAS